MRSKAKKSRAALEDIIQYSQLIQEFLANIDIEKFLADQKTICAVIRCLEVISEASRRLPDEMKAQYSNIEWNKISAAGNIYRHEYDALDLRWVWQTAKNSTSILHVFAETELKLLIETN